MKIKDLLPFHRKKEKPVEIKKAPQLFRHYESPLDHFFGDFERFFPTPFREWGLQRVWDTNGVSPDINVSETEKAIKIEAELPGLDEKDINVSIDNGYLTLSGEKKHESRDEKAHRIECSYGFFERTVSLPEYAKADAAKAHFKRGVLEIEIPKNPKKKTGRSIPISVG